MWIQQKPCLEIIKKQGFCCSTGLFSRRYYTKGWALTMQYLPITLLLIPLLMCGCNKNEDMSAQIEQTLKDNPQIVMDLIRENSREFMETLAQAQQHAQREQFFSQVKTEMEEERLAPEISGSRIALGNPDAQTDVVVYSDFLCGYCAQGDVMIQHMLEAFGDDIRVILKHMPMQAEASQVGAKYVEALYTLDKQKAITLYHDLFKEQRKLAQNPERHLEAKLKELGLTQKEITKVKDLVASSEISSIIAKDVLEAQSFGIQGTPTFLIDGVIFRGMAPEEWMLEALEMIILDTKQKRSADDETRR
jgi:protein-disulfide isomerase